MKKFILSVIIAISILFSFSACGPQKHITDSTNTEVVYGYSRMEYTMDKNLCQYQVDSMITVDHMVPLNKWIATPFGNRTQYLYIKRLGDDELVYTITTTPCDTVYKCTKRITKEIK